LPIAPRVAQGSTAHTERTRPTVCPSPNRTQVVVRSGSARCGCSCRACSGRRCSGSTSPCAKGFREPYIVGGSVATHDRPIVFVEETRPLPRPIRDVETAIPAFIGATQKASSAIDRVNAVDPAGSANTDLLLKPTLIRSMRDFEEFFGDAGAIGATVHVTENAGAYTAIRVDDPTTHYPLYFAVRMFFDNGGQRCFVASVGTRTALAPVPTLASLTSGVDAVAA